MGFEAGKRTGKTWDDVVFIDRLMKESISKDSKDSIMTVTGKNEKDYERHFSALLVGRQDKINGKLITQLNKNTTVQSVYCFGKKHRPDMAINDDGIAIEIKYINDDFDGVKMALGQSMMYRLRYRFVVNVLVVSEKNKEVYEKIINHEEKDLEDILLYMAEEMRVYTYIIPNFPLKKGQKRVFDVNGIEELTKDIK